MTMQVGMVGSDGIILASDTKWMNTGDARQTSSSSKIRFNDNRTVAISCARNMENAVRIAEEVISRLKTDQDWEYPILAIEEIAKGVLDPRGDPERNDAQCLIVSLRPTLQLFCLEVAVVNRQAGSPLCRKILDKAVIGDRVNAAIFWSERYYERKPIRNLMPLAAHLIVSASKLNPVAISGLEVILCEQAGMHRLADKSISELVSKANEWDENMRKSLASYSPEVSYSQSVA